MKYNINRTVNNILIKISLFLLNIFILNNSSPRAGLPPRTNYRHRSTDLRVTLLAYRSTRVPLCQRSVLRLPLSNLHMVTQIENTIAWGLYTVSTLTNIIAFLDPVPHRANANSFLEWAASIGQTTETLEHWPWIYSISHSSYDITCDCPPRNIYD